MDLPRTVSNIIRNDLNNLTLESIQYLCFGGNRKLIDFRNIDFPHLKNLSPIYFYQTYAMDYYRKCLEYLIKGGVKPTKPDKDKAYELITPKFLYLHDIENNNILNDDKSLKLSKSANFTKIKSDIYINMKMNNIYTKIKPICGKRNNFSYTRSPSGSSKNSDSNINLTSNDYPNKSHTISRNFKYKYYSYLKNNYDKDINNDEMFEINEQMSEISITDELSSPNEKNVNQYHNIDNINNINNINYINNANNIKLKNLLNKNRVYSNIPIKQNYNSININDKNIITKPIVKNNTNIYRNNDLYNLNKFKSKTSTLVNHGKIYINSIENSKNNYNKTKFYNKAIYVLQKNYNSKNELSLNDSKQIKDKKRKKNVNNRNNNNKIVNQKLNFFYNNNSNYNLRKIFKKKQIRNSFSKTNINRTNNNSLEKCSFFNGVKGEEDYYDRKKKMKNEYKKKFYNIIVEKNNENTFIKVNKLDHRTEPSINNNPYTNFHLNTDSNLYNIRNNTNKSTYYNIYSPDNNIKIEENKENQNQNSDLIQKLSKVFKMRNERKKKMKSLEKIRVNQRISKLSQI